MHLNKMCIKVYFLFLCSHPPFSSPMHIHYYFLAKNPFNRKENVLKGFKLQKENTLDWLYESALQATEFLDCTLTLCFK